MSIPLVQEATKDAINTSIIAIKRNIERINMLLGLSNSEEIDTSEFIKKSDIVDVVEAGNMNPVTSNAVVPVDEVTSGNMQSVSSNAVYNETRLVDSYEQTDYQIYKVGRICFCHVGFIATPHTTPIVLAIVPDKYKPYYPVRSIWFNNGDDSYGGQLILDLAGNLNVWNGGGGAFTQNIAVQSTFVYLSAS